MILRIRTYSKLLLCFLQCSQPPSNFEHLLLLMAVCCSEMITRPVDCGPYTTTDGSKLGMRAQTVS